MALSSRHGMGDCLYAHACVHERAGRANSTSAGPESQEKTGSDGAGGYSFMQFEDGCAGARAVVPPAFEPSPLLLPSDDVPEPAVGATTIDGFVTYLG